jgi:hypothetical protein
MDINTLLRTLVIEIDRLRYENSDHADLLYERAKMYSAKHLAIDIPPACRAKISSSLLF